MSSSAKDLNRSLAGRELRTRANGTTNDEQIFKILDNLLLKEERREEAKKPLFLTRYE